MTFGSLFAGIGGLDLGLERAGMSCQWQVEIDGFCQKVLHKHWPDVPKHKDIHDVGKHNLSTVDVICGGFPCQDVSVAGKGAGIKEGNRWGLWFEYHRIIRELRPRYVLVENVPGLLSSTHTETIPNDQCVCGWPYRRRGLHHNRTEQEILQSSHRCGNESPRPSGNEVAQGSGRGEDSQDKGCNERMGSGLGVGVVRPRCGRVSIRDTRTSASEEETCSFGDGISRTNNGATEKTERIDRVDRRFSGIGWEDAFADEGVEPEGACPSCGKQMDNGDTRLIQHSGMGRVLGDLAEIGYDAEWQVLSAKDVGAPHLRKRVFIVAYPSGEQCDGLDDNIRDSEQATTVSGIGNRCGAEDLGNAQHTGQPATEKPRSIAQGSDRDAEGQEQTRKSEGSGEQHAELADASEVRLEGAKQQWEQKPECSTLEHSSWWDVEPDVGRVANGVPDRIHRLKSLGNAVVPQCAEYMGHYITQLQEKHNDMQNL